VVRIVLSVVMHLNKIIVCYIIFTSKCEISFHITFNNNNNNKQSGCSSVVYEVDKSMFPHIYQNNAINIINNRILKCIQDASAGQLLAQCITNVQVVGSNYRVTDVCGMFHPSVRDVYVG